MSIAFLQRVWLQPICHVLLRRTGLRLAHVALRQRRTQSSGGATQRGRRLASVSPGSRRSCRRAASLARPASAAGAAHLLPGDILLAFTDGITSEAMDSAEDEWGEDRMIAEGASARGPERCGVVAALASKVDASAAGAAQTDDMTLVVLRLSA